MLCAAALTGANASAAFAGEVTGKGKPTAGPTHANSICVFSGKNDDPEGLDPSNPGEARSPTGRMSSLVCKSPPGDSILDSHATATWVFRRWGRGIAHLEEWLGPGVHAPGPLTFPGPLAFPAQAASPAQRPQECVRRRTLNLCTNRFQPLRRAHSRSQRCGEWCEQWTRRISAGCLLQRVNEFTSHIVNHHPSD